MFITFCPIMHYPCVLYAWDYIYYMVFGAVFHDIYFITDNSYTDVTILVHFIMLHTHESSHTCTFYKYKHQYVINGSIINDVQIVERKHSPYIQCKFCYIWLNVARDELSRLYNCFERCLPNITKQFLRRKTTILQNIIQIHIAYLGIWSGGVGWG